MTHTHNPFRLSLKPHWLSTLAEKALALDGLAQFYDRRPNQEATEPCAHVDDFLDYTLKVLNAQMEITNPEAMENIPETGPLIMVANHPLGGLEGVAMTRVLKERRPDLKVLTNELLSRIPEFSDIFVGVDVLSKTAASKNVKGIREIMRHLKKGGALLIYPAGMVSAIDTKDWKIKDRDWNSLVGKLAQQTKATCMPFHAEARNSKLFYLSGLIHPRLRTVLLPRELAKQGRQLKLTVGHPILWRDMRTLDSSEDITSYLRTASDLLSQSHKLGQTLEALSPLQPKERTEAEELAIQAALTDMAEHLLLQHQDFDVYCTPYAELGPIMHEIAVTRERTFRAAGEGTGFEADSDRYDPHYQHLFIWDRVNSRIVGSYRVGKTDEIIQQLGVDGLYSRSLYRYDAEFLDKLGGAIEVGRSFVAPEYQRHPRTLDLLWQGLGLWIVRNPDYHTLFGCVSISSEHSQRARAFLEDSLMANYRAEQEFLNGVHPIKPLKVKDRVWSEQTLKSLSNMTLINKLLGQCDPGKSVPVLLRHYIALNGRFIGFSVNDGFNDSLDGLIMVDLRKTPIKYLQRYLGKEGSESFLKLWSSKSDVA